MLKVCGGMITSAFFELENRAIDEVIYLIELTAKVAEKDKPVQKEFDDLNFE